MHADTSSQNIPVCISIIIPSPTNENNMTIISQDRVIMSPNSACNELIMSPWPLLNHASHPTEWSPGHFVSIYSHNSGLHKDELCSINEYI